MLADQVGIDYFGVGEHHRDDFAVSAPEVVLAAIAGRTERIQLGTAVTVLSSDDPVRVFERFATLDAMSDGRAEIIARPRLVHRVVPAVRLRPRRLRGAVRGEARPVRRSCWPSGPVTWEGTVRAALADQRSTRRPRAARIPTWVGVGGSPESVVRAASYGLPLMLAIIGGDPARFAPYVDLYLPGAGPVRPGRGCRWPCTRRASSPTTDEEAAELFWPHYKARCTTGSAGSAAGRRMTRERVRRRDRDARLAATSARPRRSRRKIAPTVQTLGVAALRPEVLERDRCRTRTPAEHRALRHQGHPARSRAARQRSRSRRRLTPQKAGAASVSAASPASTAESGRSRSQAHAPGRAGAADQFPVAGSGINVRSSNPGRALAPRP